jgi:hypothetical protein
MKSKRALLCAVSLMMAASGPLWAAQAKKAAAKPRGKTETLACRLGTEDRHARIAVVVIGGKTDSFAYYSKWKPRTCSVYLQRNRDMYSKWADSGNITTVNLEKGAFLIEHRPGEYHFIFRDIDRERYCGMDGVINGSLTIKRGSEACVLDGELMVEGTPLGEASVARQEQPPPALMSDVKASESAPAAAPAAAAASPKPAAPAAAVSTSKPAAAAPAPAAAPAAAVDAAPAAPAAPAVAAPSAAIIEKPAASAPGEGAASAPPAEPSAASGATGVVPAAAAKPVAAQAPQSAETSADAPSGNPFSAFFRSIKPGTPEAAKP